MGGVAVALILGLAAASARGIIYPWMGTSLVGLVNLVAVAFFAVAICYNYFTAYLTDAGATPPGYTPDKSIKGPRFCFRCQEYKPPRSHHCSDCDRCTLKMDHHCPWVGNCIGYYNHKNFLLFLIYVVLGCSHSCFLAIWRLTRLVIMLNNPSRRVRNMVESWQLVTCIIAIVLILAVLIGVGSLLYWQLSCLWNNITTIEDWEIDREERKAKSERRRPIKFPFDVSPGANFRSVLGESVWSWLVPIGPSGDGLKYRTTPGVPEDAQFFWPPRYGNTYDSD